MSYLHRKQGLCFLVYVDDREIVPMKAHLSQMWAILKKNVDVEDPVSLIDQVRLWCTQPGAQIKNKIVVDKRMFLA